MSDGSRSSPGHIINLLEFGLRWPPESFIQDKLRGLGARGFRIVVAARIPPLQEAPAILGLELRRVPYWAEPPYAMLRGAAVGLLRLLLTRPRRLKALLAALARERHRAGWGWREAVEFLRVYLSVADLTPDVVHYEWESAAARFIGLASIWGCPTVVSCRSDGVQTRATEGMESWPGQLPYVFRTATAVHCVSQASIRGCAVFGLEPSNVCLIRPAVDLTLFCPASAGSSTGPRFSLLAVGRLSRWKGFDDAITAVSILRRRSVPATLTIYGQDPGDDHGEPSDRSRLMTMVSDLGLGTCVSFRSWVTQAELRTAYRESDALVHPSLSEGVPNVVLEAMACALPVVVTDAGGTPEAVTDGVEGFVVSKRAPDELADRLYRLWTDPTLLARMGRAGRDRAVSGFDLRLQIDQWATLYSRVVAANGVTPALS